MSAKDMPIESLIREKREEIVNIAARHGAANVRLVGSVARGEEGPESDVDILVDEGSGPGQWFLGELQADLEKLLGRHVDVLSNRNIHPLLRPHILPDAIPLDRPLPYIPGRLAKKKKDDRIYLEHIVEAEATIRRYTAGGREAFLDSDLVQDATLLKLQNLTKSTQKLSAELRARHPDIDWSAIARFRNRIVYDYTPGTLDLNLVWAVIETDLPGLLAAVSAELETR